jgi:hypothetical protein
MMQVWDDANYTTSEGYIYNSYELCIYGTGSANISDYNFPCGPYTAQCTWNDAISSFKSGQQNGYFYWNSNDGGANYWFSSGEYCSYIGNHLNGSNVANWNDQISSIKILYTGAGSTNYC